MDRRHWLLWPLPSRKTGVGTVITAYIKKALVKFLRISKSKMHKLSFQDWFQSWVNTSVNTVVLQSWVRIRHLPSPQQTANLLEGCHLGWHLAEGWPLWGATEEKIMKMPKTYKEKKKNTSSPHCHLCPWVPGSERHQDNPPPSVFTGYQRSELFSLSKREVRAGWPLAAQDSSKMSWEKVMQTIAEDEFSTAFQRLYERCCKCIQIGKDYLDKSWEINTFPTLTIAFPWNIQVWFWFHLVWKQ